jgi:hypothetical protein
MVMANADLPKVPKRIIVHAVAGLSLASIIGYVTLAFLIGANSETLLNIALTGIGILGGIAMPQDGTS